MRSSRIRIAGAVLASAVYIATSLDGRIADSSGNVSFLDDYQDEGVDYGYHRFFRGIGAIVMGRRTYNQILEFGDWPYGGRPAYVVTHRRLELQLSTVRRAPKSLEATVQEAQDAASGRDVWILGGASIIEQCARLGLIDRWEIFVMPTVLGEGPPLFAEGVKDRLRLLDHHAYPNGALRLVYASASAET